MKHTDDQEKALFEPELEENPICGRREERDSDFRRRILSTAKTLFQTHNIEDVTMHQIAKEAGVGQGTLYRRYSHIGDVCSDLLRSTTNQFLTSLEAEIAENKPDLSAMKQLSECVVRIIDFIDEKATLLSTIVSMHTDKRSFSLHKKPLFVRLHNLMAPLVIRAVEQGEIQPIDVTLTVNTILASLIPDQYLYHREVLGYTKEQFTEGICRLFVKGI